MCRLDSWVTSDSMLGCLGYLIQMVKSVSLCKNGVEDAGHFFFDCMSFRENYTNLKTTLFNANPSESNSMFSFLVNLDRRHKTMFLLGGLSLPFDSKTTTIVKRFVSTAVGKIYKIRSNKLRDLEAPWLKVK